MMLISPMSVKSISASNMFPRERSNINLSRQNTEQDWEGWLHLGDIRLPSVCHEYVLLPLVIKEAVLANGLVE